MTTILRNVVLLQRDLPKAVAFYRDGLGLKLHVFTEKWAEFRNGGTILSLKQVEGEAFCSVGFSPILNFSVNDLQGTLTRLLQLGGIMDGPVQYALQGKIATIRAPDGHMISLFEQEETEK
eukprot:g7356.t1